ncbi:MAG: rhodanese-like domain-containing protein, partial [Candidatus Competibacterales bacterium]
MAVLKLLDPEALARECRGPRAPLVVDVGDGTRYLRGHIPNAVHLDYAHLVAGIPPAPGLPPHDPPPAAAVAAHGRENGRAVVAEDAP